MAVSERVFEDAFLCRRCLCRAGLLAFVQLQCRIDRNEHRYPHHCLHVESPKLVPRVSPSKVPPDYAGRAPASEFFGCTMIGEL